MKHAENQLLSIDKELYAIRLYKEHPPLKPVKMCWSRTIYNLTTGGSDDTVNVLSALTLQSLVFLLVLIKCKISLSK